MKVAVTDSPPGPPAGPLVNPSQPKDQRVALRTAIPGPASRDLRAREDAHMAPGIQGYAVMAGIVVEEAQGSAVTDVDSNTFLDFIGGIAVNALGHSHPRFVATVQRQVAQASVGSFTSRGRVDLVERLAQKPPAPGLHRLQLYSGGAEAVESALRLAKSHTGKYEFVSFWGGFHGKTMGALSLMGSRFKDKLGPMVPGSHQVPYADCYRCPLKLEYPSCGVACADLARQYAKVATAGEIAAFIIEPMQGTAGNVIPPPEFLPAIKSIAEDVGALFIADEMITGLGRTGRRWGVEHSGVRPDIVTIGKAFGGGFPLSGVLTTDEISVAKPWSVPSGSSSSYGGNPLGAAAGAEALKIIDDEHLTENARVVGEFMLRQLRSFVDRYPFVGFVDGAGLFLRVELVKDKKTKEPLPRAITERIFGECVRRGLLTMAYTASFRIQPALTIDEATARNGLAILGEVFDTVLREKWWV
ncbi:MAG: aspartate aminotransferase family protein [Deltaproteobacteria bacterium]|nr:aspartate aminotransferase family protein [Deltaproteobacteria bacterium]